MHKLFRLKAYESQHGPHFNEEYARKAVSKMQNEDGSRGPHWSLDETTQFANQYGVNLNTRFNRYDWYVALNMIYSDYYRVIMQMTNSNNIKHYVEFAKAWLNDKDIDEGKMWYYFIYVMCDVVREEEMECYEDQQYSKEDNEFDSPRYSMNRGRMRSGNYARYNRMEDYDEINRDRDYDEYQEYRKPRTTRYIRY